MSATETQRPVTERRVFNLTKCEVRSSSEGTTFSGYAAVFNELSLNLGGFREVIRPGCFRDAVDEGQDVRFLINHEPNLILGRTRSHTITLVEDEIGLRVDCTLPDTSYARDLTESMRRKDVDQMSFGFVTREDAWREKDPETGLPIRELLRADLFDVSVVVYPAYPDTTAEVRSYLAEHQPDLLERAARAADEIAAPAKRVGKTLSQKNKDALAQAHQILGEVLAAAEPADGEAGVVNDQPDASDKLDLDVVGGNSASPAGETRADSSGEACGSTDLPLSDRDESWDASAAQQSLHSDDYRNAHFWYDGGPADEIGSYKLPFAHRTDSGLQAVWKGVTAGAARLNQTQGVDESAVQKKMEVYYDKANKQYGDDSIEPPWKDDSDRSAAGPPETREIARPDLKAFREWVAERGWNYEDDSNVWALTQMIELGSCLLLFADDDDADDQPLMDGVGQIMQQLAQLLTVVVTEAGSSVGDRSPADVGDLSEPDNASDVDDISEGEQRTTRFDIERRRLSLLERELDPAL